MMRFVEISASWRKKAPHRVGVIGHVARARAAHSSLTEQIGSRYHLTTRRRVCFASGVDMGTDKFPDLPTHPKLVFDSQNMQNRHHKPRCHR